MFPLFWELHLNERQIHTSYIYKDPEEGFMDLFYKFHSPHQNIQHPNYIYLSNFVEEKKKTLCLIALLSGRQKYAEWKNV